VTRTYADLATTHYVLDPVSSELGLRSTGAGLADRISTVVPVGTEVIELTASDDTPSRAARIANAVAARLVSTSTALAPARTAANRSPSVRLTQVESARVPAAPAEPQALVDLPLGLLAGLGGGLLAATLLERRAEARRRAGLATSESALEG
jgi:capsular polysaccharide biosynthesis protein